MKTSTVLGLLVLSTNAAVIKRQGHSHDGASTYGILGLEGFKIPGLNFALPKDGISAMFTPSVRKAYKIEQIPPQKYKEARRIRITYGPYNIRATSVSLRLSG